MKIIILGSNGQLGQSLLEILLNTHHEVYPFSKHALDILDKSRLCELIREISPDFIINCAAYTNVDKAEEDIENANLINHIALNALAEACILYQVHLIHISTDYVFDGTKNGYYNESDSTNPKNIYGLSKLNGEKVIEESKCSYTILRTSWVFSEHGNNFLKTMLKLSKKDVLSVVSDQYGCPTYAGDIAQTIKQILEHQDSNEIFGIFHYAGATRTSWYDFAKFIFLHAYKLGLISTTPSLRKILSSDYPTKASRPMNSSLDSSLICDILKIQPTKLEQSVVKVLKRLI